ncbi:uncharacterized protein LOC131437342 [Malaya genurostris]|uniref:uncharacterized protein LOC131437342 n=1 Tax=Malaya genurostris TaxID=325434 RepID=UPI0026F399D5|nr:uncharacterized protein LOC131437342 [Malaya genurostris]
MFTKIIVFIVFLAVACVSAKPGLVAPVAYTAPVLAAAPAVVTAQSSQFFARNYNGIAPLAYTAVAPVAYAAAPAFAAYAAAPVLL